MYNLSLAGSFSFSSSRSSDDADAVYVLDLKHVPAGLVSTSSDHQLALFDPERVRAGPVAAHRTGHGTVRALAVVDWGASVVATGGDDGGVTVWDLRGQGAVGQFKISDHAVLSLACGGNTLAAGTDLQNHEALISLWDLRSPTQSRQYSIHSDDVTQLEFQNTLLSGSTDGLINVTDTSVADEDEAVVDTINHGASIHRAGRIGGSVFALSHDERFAVYGERAVDFGDLREVLGCRYVADVASKTDGSGAVIGIGAQDRSTFELVFLSDGFDTRRVALQGAHGTDVVRAFCFLDQEQVVFSGGEDGQVRAWRV